MKIVRIITRLNIGGPALHAILLTAGLPRPAYETVLVTGQPESTEGDLTEAAEQRGVRWIRVPALRQPLHPLRDLWAWWCVFCVIRREHPDLVHTHMAKAGALGRTATMAENLLRRLRGGLTHRPQPRCRMVHTFHGHVLDGYFSAWVSRMFLAIEQWLATRTDCLIAVSPAIREALLEKGIGRPEQWQLVPVGLDLASLATVPSANGQATVRIGMVGRLVPIKNPGLFLTALHRLVKREREATITGLVVGDGPLRGALERQAQELGLQSAVQFTGWRRDLRAVYKELEVACLTSWNEGTPVSLIEAMACARAVVATDVGGVRDVLGEPAAPAPAPGQCHIGVRGVLVRPGDVEGLTAALELLARDPALRQRLGVAARDRVLSVFGQERLLRDIIQVYEQVGAMVHP